MKKTIGIAAVLSGIACFAGGHLAEAAKRPSSVGHEPSSQSKRAKKDFGEMSMLLGDVGWQGTSARAKRKNTTLIITGARTDGPIRSMVRQSVDLYLPEFDGPGTYTAKIGSQFLVVGIKLDAETDTGMDSAMVEALSKAQHLQLEGAEIVVESASDTEVAGSFSFERGPTAISNGRFRALYRKKK